MLYPLTGDYTRRSAHPERARPSGGDGARSRRTRQASERLNVPLVEALDVVVELVPIARGVVRVSRSSKLSPDWAERYQAFRASFGSRVGVP